MWIHPSLFFFIGALVLPWLRGSARSAAFVGFPLCAVADVFVMRSGNYGLFEFAGQILIFGRVDTLSLVFAHVFTLIAVIGSVFALRTPSKLEPSAVFLYAGGALGAVFAGDLLTLFLFWEVMAFTSATIVWCGGDRAAGFRYLLIHMAGGGCLLVGTVIHAGTGHGLLFGSLVREGGLGAGLILMGVLVNAAAPPLHAWLSDAYPKATVTGTVFLSAFTTKTAVYVLVRGFAGTEWLVGVGVLMALYGVFYAMIENNVRRLLSYHIVSQVGFMVAGVGIGTPLAINGAVAHAFAHILYKALLMMGMGSVVFATGRQKGTELGGLYRTMPLTCILFLVGGVSISGVPLFSGFVSKSMILSAASEAYRPITFLLLTLASCGTFLSTTLKLPHMVFFGENRSSMAATDPPKNMLVGMSLAAAACLLIGLFPDLLYRLLPYESDYIPYTAEHLTGTLQLLLATAAIFLLFLPKLHPHAVVNLDFDRLYNAIGRGVLGLAQGPITLWERFLAWADTGLIVRPVRWLTLALRHFDTAIIDGAVNDVARGVLGGSRLSNWVEKYVIYSFINVIGYANHMGARLFRRLQTGSVHNYAMMIIVGIFLLINAYLLYRSGATPEIPDLLHTAQPHVEPPAPTP